VIKNNVVQATEFLDIHTKVSCCGEQGLLSVAFPPGYASKRYFYVNYTDTAGNTVVARYRLTGNDDIADATSEQAIINIAQPFANHNGGQLAFGPDGDLYIGMGDGGSGGDPGNRAQDTTQLLGKILRLDVERPTPTGTPAAYAVPSSNPVMPTPGARREIWARGVRNPWRFSFDRLTGDLYIGDVGQDSFEEVDFQPASSLGGENYGWRIMEGFHCFNPASCSSTGLTLPVSEYSHASGDCSITGGLVYRGTTYPCMHGTYFFGDYCSGRIWGLRRAGATWQSMLLYDAPYNVTSFGDDEAGNLWVTNYTNGAIQLLTDGCSSATLTPTPTITPTRTPTGTPTSTP
jgi:glucose/arabinose dehydrogenase